MDPPGGHLAQEYPVDFAVAHQALIPHPGVGKGALVMILSHSSSGD